MPAPWWAIKLSSVEWERGDGSETGVDEPGGVLEPILVNAIGETLAGVWIPEGDNWRWYVVPWATDWRQLVEWLVTRAVPEYVPGALRRGRAAELVDDELLTGRELSAKDALARFEERAALERSELENQVAAARSAATDVRFGLLYGTGASLVVAVRRVLEEAGFSVEDLDETLGAGASADLVVSREGHRWLVEVKSASGNAGEDLVEDLQRHLRVWPGEEVAGGILIVNHQHGRPPLERQPVPYTRQEFVASLPGPVISSLALFGWWRDGDRDAIINAISGAPEQYVAELHRRHSPEPDSTVPQVETKSMRTARDSEEQRGRRAWHRRFLRRPDAQ